MRTYTHRQSHMTRLLVGLMLLVFWLIILFLDGAFSSYRSLSEQDASCCSTSSFFLDDVVEMEDDISFDVSHIGDVTSISSDTDTVSSMLTDTLHYHIGSSEIFKDLNVLEYLYTKNKNPDLLEPMIESFLHYYQFEKANHYLALLVKERGSYVSLNIDPHKVLYARLHDSSVHLDSTTALDDVLSLVKEYRSSGKLFLEDELFYQGLRSLWIYDYDSAMKYFSQLTLERYQSFVHAYESALSTYVSIDTPPLYYKDGLISLTLLKQGYFSLAKKLALRALRQNDSYILPYQVLGYTNFLTQHWETAKDYFLMLVDIDSHNVAMYRFLIGISYYWHGAYEKAILYLNQISDVHLQTDVYRYMLLSYIEMEDTTNMLRMRHNLLGQSGLQTSDFTLFFDQLVYFPFRSGSPFVVYSANPQLVDLYLSKCSTLFSDSQADVCLYGDVGLQLVQQNLSLVGTKLLSLTQTYQQSHLYHVLGEYYTEIKQYAMAKDSYAKALSIADTLAEQTLLKEKISSID